MQRRRRRRRRQQEVEQANDYRWMYVYHDVCLSVYLSVCACLSPGGCEHTLCLPPQEQWLSWIAQHMWPPNEFNEEMFSFATEARRQEPSNSVRMSSPAEIGSTGLVSIHAMSCSVLFTVQMLSFCRTFQCLCDICSTMTFRRLGDIDSLVRLRAPPSSSSPSKHEQQQHGSLEIPISERSQGFAILTIGSPFLCILSSLAACASLGVVCGKDIRGIDVAESFHSVLMASLDRAYGLPDGDE